MRLTNQQLLMLLLIGGGVAWYLKNEAVEKLEDAAAAINPVNRDNAIYGGVNAVGEALTGENDFSLGGWIYEKIHGDGV